MLLRKFHDIESKAFSKSINKNKPGISFSYSVGSLSVTQKQGIITCLPKGDKSRHFLKKLAANFIVEYSI
jgi:hypothetical protein